MEENKNSVNNVQVSGENLDKHNMDYTSENIKLLEGIEAIRTRPGMYVAGIGEDGLHQLVTEVIDNSVDEHLAGYCTKVKVTIHANGSLTVQDNGRGIPVEIHEKTGISALQVVLTNVHAGGKFNNDAYEISGGLHGVGLTAVNALSEMLRVEVHRNGKKYLQLYRVGIPEEPVKELGPTDDSGTIITFKPDPEIMEVTEFNHDRIRNYVQDMAFLNPGLEITLVNETIDTEETFLYEGGLLSLVKEKLVGDSEPVHENPILIEGKRTITEDKKNKASSKLYRVTAVIQWVESTSRDGIKSYCNNIATKDGGTHLSGLRAGVTKAVKDYIDRNNSLKSEKEIQSTISQDKQFLNDIIRQGLIGVVSVKIPDPIFEGQSKAKLSNKRVQSFVEEIVKEELGKVLDSTPDLASKVIEFIIDNANAIIEGRRVRQVKRKKPGDTGSVLPGKMADCQTNNPAEAEIFIVEGDSAGGSAKQARDRRTQAVLPLRGKILNVEKAKSLNRILLSEQISVLVSAIGTSIGNDFDIEQARYHKIIIMTDADVDGAHISSLLLTFFFNEMRELIERGYVYIAQPPLYRIQKGKQVLYLKDDNKYQEYIYNEAVSKVAGVVDGDDLRSVDIKGILKKIKRVNKIVPGFVNRHLVKDDELLKHIVFKFEGDSSWLESKERIEEFMDWFTKHTVEYHPEIMKMSFEIEEDSDWDAYKLNVTTIRNIGKTNNSVISKELYTDVEFLELTKLAGGINELGPLPFRLMFGEGDSKQVKEFLSIDEFYDFMDKIATKGLHIQRYKGLGEMNPDQLWETTMNPETRSLVQIKLTDIPETERVISILMGDDAQPRKVFIEERASTVKNLDI